MKRLFISEKPSVAKAIAQELGVTSKNNGYLECGNDIVTWCFGHLLELESPDYYTGSKEWKEEDLPIIPENWISKPKPESEKQLKVIGSLLKSDVGIVVSAGDPDREGNYLIDEVLDHFNNKKPVLRYWANAIDETSVRRALSNMKDQSEYAGMTKAAEGRSKADWLVGMNLSRAFTLRAKRGGGNALITAGRVQTPTLNLVVTRDLEIATFKPIPFHTLVAIVNHSGGSFKAKFAPSEEQAGLDQDGRLVDTKIADQIKRSVESSSGVVSDYEQKKKTTNHPLPFSLSGLTTVASKRFGFSAEDVLNICQSLYEKHKLTSYPRTDCQYLPESQFEDVSKVLAAIKSVDPRFTNLIDKADTSIKSKSWNDKKVTAHHGIIPTMHRGNIKDLNPKELKLYELIVRTYLAQFYPVHEYLSTNIELNFSDYKFKASGKVVTNQGWSAVYKDDSVSEEQDEDKQELPKIKAGDAVKCSSCDRRDSKTKAPSKFTEGTLINAMVNVHRFVTDPKDKKMLRDGDGIGTEATRASIISELKRRGYLQEDGKHIVSTPLGRKIVSVLPNIVKSPVLTALYERILTGVESGEHTLEEFLSKQIAMVKDQVAKAADGSVKIDDGRKAAVSDKYKCKSCGSGLVRRKGQKSFWWGCSNYPECKQTYPDTKGQPNYQLAQSK